MPPFKPNLKILPAAQLKLWHELAATPNHFVLYGGTAIALRLGHRLSVDFDFFSSKPFTPSDLYNSVPYLKDSEVTQRRGHTLTCLVQSKDMAQPVKVSFFGGLDQQTILPTEKAEGNNIQIASMHDLFGMKCATIADRIAIKDYQDIHAILEKTSLTLQDGIAAAKTIYGKSYQPMTTLKALSYFKGSNFSKLDGRVKQKLLHAVKQTRLSNIPNFPALGLIGKQPTQYAKYQKGRGKDNSPCL